MSADRCLRRPRRPGRPIAGLAALGLLAALAGACSSTDKPRRELMPLRFGVLQTFDQLPYFVMRAKGFDTARGLRIEETVAQGGASLFEGLVKGTLDMAFTGSVPTFNASRVGTIPGAVTVVGSVGFADAGHRAFALLARAGVGSWADLAGQAIAINQPGTVPEAAIRARLRQEGVSGVRLVSVPFPNQGLAVAGGNVAAAVLVEPFITQSLLRGDGHVLDWVVGGGEPFPDFQISMTVVSTTFATAHPDTVRAFLRALLDSVRWIADHEQDARELLAQRLGLTQEVGRKMYLARYDPNARNDPALLEQTRRVLVDLAPTPAPLPVAELYDETLLEEVLATRGSP